MNLGVRLESTPAWHEKVGRIERFTLVDDQNNVHSTVFPRAPRRETFRGDPSVPEDGTDASTYDLGPRVGFAWDITGNGMIRKVVAASGFETLTSQRENR